MCEQTEVHYLEGDVVWVKLGACWWPGRVRDVDKLPDDILESFRKKPIAAVQFFNEDKYEYVKNLDQICRYNCRRKSDFIKKGLDMFRAKQREGSSFMDKFPNDVSMAEQLTGGNPNIVADHAFAPEEKPSYRGLFGNEKKAEKKGKVSSSSPVKGSPSWRNKLDSPSTPSSSPRRPITHPRMIRMLKGEEEQHDVRIRQQPAIAQRPPSPQNEPYKCYKCDFTSKRLNVVIIHSKSHSGDGATNGQEPKHVRKSTGSVSTPPRGRGRPRGSLSGSVGRPPKISQKIMPVNSTDTDEASTAKSASSAIENTEENAPKEIVPSPEKKSPKTPVFGKRKNSKTAGDKITKKKKSSEDFREKLLAEWADEDQEEEEKEMMILKQELSKSEALSSPPPEQGSEKMNYSTNKITASSNIKPKEISCFDFDEKADSLLDHELEERAKKFAEARKFPRRLDDKMEIEKRTENTEPNLEIPKYREEVPMKITVKVESGDHHNNENKDLKSEFENLMAETELPTLPDVPNIKTAFSEHETRASPELESALNDKVETVGQNYFKEEETVIKSTVKNIESTVEPPPNVVAQPPVEVPHVSSFELPSEPTVELVSECLKENRESADNAMHFESHGEISTNVPTDMPPPPPPAASEEPSIEFSLEKPADTVSEIPSAESTAHTASVEYSEPANEAVNESDQICDSQPASSSRESEQISDVKEISMVPCVQEPVQDTVTLQQTPISVAGDLNNVPLSQEEARISVLQEATQASLSQAQISICQEATSLPIAQDSVQMSLDEMELDINSMPVVMGDTLLTEDPTTKLTMNTIAPANSVAITLPPPVVSETAAVPTVMRITSVSAASSAANVPSGTVTLNVTPTLELVTEASTSVVKSSAQTTTANSAPKIVKQLKSVKIQPGPSGSLRTSDGSIIAPKGTTGANRFVLIQHPSGKHSIYATSSTQPGQQCIVKTGTSQSQGSQAPVGKKLVIVKSSQGTTVSPEVLSTLQQGLGSGRKLVPQRIITNQGTILKQMGRNTPKVMHVTPQQMKALTSGKQVGTKLTMQSTPTKVVLPTVQKMVSTQGQGLKVMAAATSAKSKPNTILIQTTQGAGVGSAIVSRTVTGNASGAAASIHAKVSGIPQTMVRQVTGTTRPKIVATASPSATNVQRVVVSTAGRGATLQGQTQQKVLTARSGVQPRLLMQKSRGPSTVRVPNVGAIAGVQSQVKKVQGVLPRTQVLQKGKQGQVIQKVVAVQPQSATTVIKPTSSTETAQSIILPSLQSLQVDVSSASAIQHNLQANTLVLSTTPTVINPNLATSQSASLPVATTAPLLSHEHIAQVIAPSGAEQLAEGGTATYVLVTIDDQGAIQPYDSSGLVTSFDSSAQSTESNTRTLFIDPSSLGTSGDLENIFLAINNPASAGSGTLLNLGQTSTVSGANISTTQHSQAVFNIADSQPAAPAASQDILAAALANTDVFQSDGSMSDSLTVVNSSQSASGSVMTSRLLESSPILPASTSTTLHQTTVLLPSLSAPAMPPANPAGVLETSLTLNQPIMTPLEVPSSVTNLQPPLPPIPTSLELPLTITQPALSMPTTSPYSTLSQQSDLQTPETEAVDSPISSSSVSHPTPQSVLSSRPTLQPSMPLLSEDVSDSQTTVTTEDQADSEIMDHQPGSSFSPVQTTTEHDSDNMVASNTSNTAEDDVLPSYAQVPEVSSHVTEEQDTHNNDMNYESNQQLSDHDLSTSYHEVPESTSEPSTSEVQGVSEIQEVQSGCEQTVSTSYARNVQDAVPKERAEVIDSSNPPTIVHPVPNYTVENSSEAVAVKDTASTQDSSPTDQTCVPYEQVESTSQLRDGLGETVTEVTHTLPSESSTLQTYAPAPESTSSVSGEVLESNSSGTFSLPSYSQTPESTCELQEEKEVAPNQSASCSYSQVPESTSHMVESRVVEDSPMDILDSSQHSLDSNVLTPYQVPESSSEASVVSYEETRGVSGVTPPSSNQTSYTSCSQVPESTSQMHEVLTFSDSSTEVSDCAVPLAQSMPLLLDSGPGTVGSKRLLDGEGTDTNDLDHSKRVKIDESER